MSLSRTITMYFGNFPLLFTACVNVLIKRDIIFVLLQSNLELQKGYTSDLLKVNISASLLLMCGLKVDATKLSPKYHSSSYLTTSSAIRKERLS